MHIDSLTKSEMYCFKRTGTNRYERKTVTYKIPYANTDKHRLVLLRCRLSLAVYSSTWGACSILSFTNVRDSHLRSLPPSLSLIVDFVLHRTPGVEVILGGHCRNHHGVQHLHLPPGFRGHLLLPSCPFRRPGNRRWGRRITNIPLSLVAPAHGWRGLKPL